MDPIKILILVAMMQAGPVELPELEVPPVQQTGWATWYGDGNWHGPITANGEAFKPLGATCASRTIPLGTIVLVESLGSGRRVWCRVNDRGPYGAVLPDGEWGVKLSRGDPGRWRGVMDLSLGTARALYDVDGRPPNGRIKIRWWRERGVREVAFR